MRSGRYEDADDVVCAGLRLLESQEDALRGLDPEEIRRLVEEARADDRLLTEDELFGELEARYANWGRSASNG